MDSVVGRMRIIDLSSLDSSESDFRSLDRSVLDKTQKQCPTFRKQARDRSSRRLNPPV